MKINLSLTNDKDYLNFCEQCEFFIREGKLLSTRHLIKQINQNQIPRQFRFKLARICRRVGAISEGLRILKKIIFNQIPGESTATPYEECEYAVLLSRNGSVDEAIFILRKLVDQKIPDVHLYLGFCLISKWNYSDAATELRKYLEQSQDPYLKVVAHVNLASSLVSSRQYYEALDLLNFLIKTEEQGGNKRLLGNCYELRAQTYFHVNSIQNAENDLAEALSIFKSSNSYDELLVQKWYAIIKSHKEKSVDSLLNFKETAFLKSHWETVREMDLYILKHQFNQIKFDYLYYGTPYESFRNRMKEEIQQTQSESYYFGDHNGIVLSLSTGEYKINSKINQVTPKIQSLINALIEDFYAPITLGSLFSKIYNGEHFDIESSPLKIRQIMSRLRKWFHKNKIDASIQQKKMLYKIHINSGIGFNIIQSKSKTDDFNRSFERIKNYYINKNEFTIGDVVSDLGISRSDFHRIMKWATQRNLLIRIGVGKQTRYRIANSVSIPSAA